MTKSPKEERILLPPGVTDFNSLWQEFLSVFPDDESSLKAITATILSDEQVTCWSCGGRDFERVESRDALCLECRETSSITAGTFFHNVRRPQAWLGAIWLTERGVLMSGMAFHRLVGIAQSSARCILNRVMFVLQHEMTEFTVDTPSGDFLGLFCRRSYETQARLHPRSEEEFAKAPASEAVAREPIGPAAHKCEDGSAGLDSSSLSETELLLLDLLSEKSLSNDDITSQIGLPRSEVQYGLTMLEISGLIKRQPGACYSIACPQSVAQTARGSLAAGEKVVNVASWFVHTIFQGISRKNLQLYLAAHWCHVHRKRWAGGELIKCCLARGKITWRSLFENVCSKVVKVASLV